MQLGKERASGFAVDDERAEAELAAEIPAVRERPPAEPELDHAAAG